MVQYTRRKLLHDIGIASASLAAAGIEGCCFCSPTADLYVLLQGPWLLSIASDSYLRAATASDGNHVYSYFDPHPVAWPNVVGDRARGGSAGPQQSLSADLAPPRLLHFEVDRGRNSERSWTLEKRSRLFDAMRDQSQGIFYSNKVRLPEVPDASLKVLEIHLSYPDAVFALDIQRNFEFVNLDSVLEEAVKAWPMTIVLRYLNWKSATFSGDNIASDTMQAGSAQIHRKFGISYNLPPGQGTDDSKPTCAAEAQPTHLKAPTPAGQTVPAFVLPPAAAAPSVTNDMDASWTSVMRLLNFKYGKESPKPIPADCKKSDCTIMPVPSDGAVTRYELDCLPTPRVPGQKLSASMVGSAGVHGVLA